MNLGAPELIIVLIIVVLIFGVGRVGKIGGELGKSIKEFRLGLTDDKDKQEAVSAAAVEPGPVEAGQAEPDSANILAPKA